MGRGATQRREQARQEMRENILRTAREMIVEEGLANLSLRGIARTLGYSPAALYEYFPSKEAIAKALYFEGADGLSGRLDQTLAELPPDTPPLEAMKALGRAYRAYAHQNEELFLLMFGSGDTFGKLMDYMVEGNSGYEALQSVVERGIESGEFADYPADALILASWTSVHGFVMLELSCVFARKPELQESNYVPSLSPDEIFEINMELNDVGILRR